MPASKRQEKDDALSSICSPSPATRSTLASAAALSESQDPATGPSASRAKLEESAEALARSAAEQSLPLPPPQYNHASSSSTPPPFSAAVAEASTSCSAAPAYSSSPAEQPFELEQLQEGTSASPRVFYDHVGETKRALPQDTKGDSSRKEDDAEPPPAYTEGDSPLQAFTYVMAAAGGAASIITQVQQGGPPINALGGTSHDGCQAGCDANGIDVGADETIAMDLR